MYNTYVYMLRGGSIGGGYHIHIYIYACIHVAWFGVSNCMVRFGIPNIKRPISTWVFHKKDPSVYPKTPISCSPDYGRLQKVPLIFAKPYPALMSMSVPQYENIPVADWRTEEPIIAPIPSLAHGASVAMMVTKKMALLMMIMIMMMTRVRIRMMTARRRVMAMIMMTVTITAVIKKEQDDQQG